jgi:hypothetical protein
MAWATVPNFTGGRGDARAGIGRDGRAQVAEGTEPWLDRQELASMWFCGT